MKLRLLLIAIPVFLYGTLKAQSGFKIGPYLGVFSSRAYVIDSLPNYFNMRLKTGFGGGISAQYGFSDKFLISAGLLYTNKGYRVFNDSNTVDNVLKHNVNNFELPVNMIFRSGRNRSSKLRFVLGGGINYQIGTTEKRLVNKNNTFIIEEKTIRKLYPLLNVGLEFANESKSGNTFLLGVYYKQSFTEQLRLNVFNSPTASQERLHLGYRGSYLGIGFTFLFDAKNFKREEVFFY